MKSNETPGNYDRVHDLGLGSNVVVLSLEDDGRTVPAVNNNGGSPESKRDTSGVYKLHKACAPLLKKIIFFPTQELLHISPAVLVLRETTMVNHHNWWNSARDLN